MDLIANESSPSDLIQKIQESGSAFTSSVEGCQQQIFSLLGGNPLDALSTAKMITAMITAESPFTQMGKSNWELLGNPANSTLPFDGTIFVAAVRAMAPTLDWTKVCHALDNPHFWVRSKAALQLLTLILISGIAPNPFPIGLIYRLWSVNKQGQLSWLGQIIQHPDVFYVLDYPHQPVGNLSCLKVLHEDSNRTVGMWKCLDLAEILFRIAQEEQALSNQVLALLRGPGPMLQCPDLLLLGVIQINTLPNSQLPQFRVHILKYLITTLLNGNANAVPVLHFAWNFENNKQQMHQIILASIGAYYAQNPEDQSRLTRILEIAHEIKALTELFSNMNQFPFVIDLAILAARRDFLKLDKFIEDKLSEHGERFAQQLCEVMKRRSAEGIHNALPSETLQLMFSVLQPRAPAWPMVAAELNQLMAQIRSKGMPGMGSTTPFGAAAPPFLPKMPDARINAGTPGIGSASSSLGGANQFTLFQQRDQMMRNLRSTPANEFRDFRNISSIHSASPNNALDFGEDLSTAHFSEEIQEEANSYFQQIYAPNGRMSVNEFINRLKMFRHSGLPRERELLMCIVKNLFDEYRFFREYPERELRTTAEVYGGILREGIIANIHFATAIRRVFDALSDEPGGMLWIFGIVALTACRSVLHKFPKMCQMITALESYGRFPPGLKEFVQAGIQGQLPINAATDRETSSWATGGLPFHSGIGGNAPFNNPLTPTHQPTSSALTNTTNLKFSAPKGITSGTSILNVTNVDILVSATERDGIQIKQPPQNVVEKVAFICNNLCTNNLMEKTQEIIELIQEEDDEFIQWFAQYLVMKRVTVEQNYQPLYNSYLLLINNKKLDQYVRKETYRNIQILLRSDKRQAASNFGDRQLLKNLGHWLGIITIGRDQPVLTKDLDLKYLLIEAFYKGQQDLLYIIPFVVKSLTSSAKSTLFGPKCAWIYKLLKVLVEIHHEPDLKLNLKFEIEVLCKELNIDLRSVEIGNYLKESSRLPKLIPVKNEGMSPIPPQSTAFTSSTMPFPSFGGTNDYSGMLSSLSISSGIAASKDSPANEQFTIATIPQPPQVPAQMASAGGKTSQSPQVPAFNYGDVAVYTQSGFMQSVMVPQHLLLFQMHPQLKYVCKTAVFHAIKELIGGIADRSISVAITATEHVCRKDFCLDVNEQNLRRAIHQMMRAMTAGMAAITCREPLATTMLGLLKQALCNAIGNMITGNDQIKMVEEAAIAVTEANIALATNFIVKNACEKGVLEIEKRFEPEFTARRQAVKEGRKLQGDADLMAAIIEKIPEQIRPKPDTINEAKMKIYDDFSSKICGFKPLTSDERFIELSRRTQMTTPAASNRTPTNAFATPFIPASVAGNLSAISGDGRPSTALQQGVISAHHPPQLPHPSAGGILPGTERMSAMQNAIFPDEQPVFPPTSVGMGARKLNDDQILQNKVENILREWITICYTPVAQRDPQSALACIVQMMHDNGVLATDEMITKFFRLCADICFDVSYRLLKNESTGQSTVVRQRCYYTLDAFTKLTCLMVKYSNGEHHSTKVNLLKKVLNILSTALAKDHEQRKVDFNGMPFHRILIIMFNELTAPGDPVLDSIQWNILEAFGQTLFMLQPRRVPGFAFHWLDIIGHRNFIGRLLADSFDLGKTGAMYTQLILCHLKFLAPFLRNVQLPKPIAFIYKGTLRVLLVILHDFPEILCDYHYVLCDAIPANCVQLRNLILSAYPRDMRLPDPFTENLSKIENLPEMAANPKTHREINSIIPEEFRKKLDDYLETRSSVNFLSDLPTFLEQSQSPGQRYNISVVNAVVMYVGVRAIDSIHEKEQRISMDTIAHTAYMDIFQNLAVSLCTEGKYLLFNAIANQLRYPNSHTHYFSCTLLYLFLEANSEQIQEQITRILFERLVALRPHPWGLLITFIELIRNPRYGFWKHDFVRCAPEIERLFLSVANSCSVASVPEQQSNGN